MSSTPLQEIEIKNRKTEKQDKDVKACQDPMNVKIISVQIANGDPKSTSRELAEILKLMAENKTSSWNFVTWDKWR